MRAPPGRLRQLATHPITGGVAAGSVVLTGLAMIVAAPMLARRPNWRGVGRAAAAATVVALLGGWLIAEAAHTGF